MKIVIKLSISGLGNNMNGTGIFKPHTVVGIHKQSKVKENAKEFLNILLSEEVQQRDRGLGIPRNKTAIAHWYERHDAWILYCSLMDKETVYKLINELDPFFQGERPAEATVAAVMEKIETYKKE